jgi:hypothetical protein
MKEGGGGGRERGFSEREREAGVGKTLIPARPSSRKGERVEERQQERGLDEAGGGGGEREETDTVWWARAETEVYMIQVMCAVRLRTQ